MFKTITDDIGNSKVSLNGTFKDFFKRESVISDDDIRALKAYNAELEKVISYETEEGKVKPIYTSAQTAFNRTLPDASEEAKNMAKGIDLVATAIDNYIHCAEYAKEAIDNIKVEYNNGTSQLASMNAELETTAQRISELENKGHLSFTEQAELDKLKEQNVELERNCRNQKYFSKQ